MDNLTNKFIKETLGSIMSKSRDALLLQDDTYVHHNNDRNNLEKCYIELQLEEKDRRVINNYISCIDTMNNRIADISYIAGVCDTIKLLNSFGLLKEYK